MAFMKRRCGFVAAGVLLAVLGGALPLRADPLVASGCSVSNVGYLTDLAKDYERLTGQGILVRGGGSVLGLEDLRSGKTDFAASCRGRESGDPDDVEFVQAAWDALVFIVHPSNPLASISLGEVQAIHQGLIRDWGQLKGSAGPIDLLISRPQKGLSGVESSTKTLVLAGKDPLVTPGTTTLASTGIVEEIVENSPAAFATTGFSSARRRQVKMLAMNGAAPTRENIIAKKYPFARPLYLVVPRSAKPEVRTFVDFVLSRRGQELIGSYGIIPLGAMRK